VKVSSPFAHHIPVDIVGNLQWRRRVLNRVLEDPSYADIIWQACSIDPIFYINGFGYTYNPRLVERPRLPFILYPFQVDGILEIIKAIGSHDLLIEKSRDTGASWVCSSAFEWLWHFRRELSFLMVSRAEALVDDRENPKALFWKVDYLLNNLPPWLMPPGYNEKIHRRKLHILNPYTSSVIDGESTQGNVARGDRRTAILLDEFAAVEQGIGVLRSTRDATNSRIFNSTPQGTGNAYYQHRKTGVRRLRFHWSVHPEKNIGLYETDIDGELRVLDTGGYRADYTPILDGKLRSPWYDRECKRATSSREIAQELDIDYLGSGDQFFSSDVIARAVKEHAMNSTHVGDLVYDLHDGTPIDFKMSD